MASDIDPTANETYKQNFGLAPLGDIHQIASEDIPEFDILCGGFPCQAFSVIGQKGGFEDPRGTLIFQVIRILCDKQPKAFILENVKGLLTHDKGTTYKRIAEELDKCGYDVSYKVLEAKDYGLPQIRKRLYIVGTRKDLKANFQFPEPTGCGILLGHILKGKTRRDYAFTIRIGGRNSGIDNKYNWDSYYVDDKVHVITPAECLQVQGFPADFKLAGNRDAQYKQVGNSVPTTIIREIGRQLVKTGILN
jgi:DNA (cytosine-5)-methyltransferase 1